MVPSEHSNRIGAAFLRNRDGVTFTPNERLMLDLIRHGGPISRADLARQTGLAMQSVVRLVDGLVARGFVGFGDKVHKAGPGQPSRSLELIADAAYTVGVSVMTDAVATVLLDLGGRVRATSVARLDVADRGAVLAHVRGALQKLTRRAGADPARLFGVGVATTGYFVGHAQLNTPISMSAWALRDLQEEFTQTLNLPVWVENDGNAAAIGESLYGAGARYSSFAYIYLAAGLGGGVVVDGQLLRGFRGNAGEFTGLLPTDMRQDRPTLSLLLEMIAARGVHLDGIEELSQKFDPDWPGVADWIARTREPLKAIVSAVAAVVDPEAIIIGGRAPLGIARLLADDVRFYTGSLRDRDRPMPLVLPAEAGGDAAAKGAAALPLKLHFFR